VALTTCKACKTSISTQAKICPKCGHPQPKKTSLFTWIVGGFFTVVVLSTCVLGPSRDREVKQEATTRSAQVTAERVSAEVAACRNERAALVSKYEALITERKYWEAARSINNCAEALKDNELKALIAKAETQEYRTVATDQKRTAKERVEAIEALQKWYPESAVDVVPMLSSLQAKASAQAEAERKKAEREDLARRKKEGVSLGMSADDVLKSSWGKPRKINRTAFSASGREHEHEQWVYDGGYLYFENGVLTSVQN